MVRIRVVSENWKKFSKGYIVPFPGTGGLVRRGEGSEGIHTTPPSKTKVKKKKRKEK